MLKGQSIFSDEYVIKSTLGNLFGLQILRYILSRLIYNLRGLLFNWQKTDQIMQLRDEGLLVIEDFLLNEEHLFFKQNFNEIAKEGTYRPIVDGDTTAERFILSKEQCFQNNILRKIIYSEKMINIVESCERKRFKDKKFHNEGLYEDEVWIDTVRNGVNSGERDSQKELHVDIFFHTHKVWFFLDDVKEDGGPLCFVKGSHKFSIKRAFFEYWNSVNYKKLDVFAFRLTKKLVGFMRLKDETKCNVKGNSLVIANTSGFHRRGDAVNFSERRQVHFRVRRNPFADIFKK